MVRQLRAHANTIQQSSSSSRQQSERAGICLGWLGSSREKAMEAHKAPGAAALDGVGEAHRHGQQGSHLQRHAQWTWQWGHSSGVRGPVECGLPGSLPPRPAMQPPLGCRLPGRPASWQAFTASCPFGPPGLPAAHAWPGPPGLHCACTCLVQRGLLPGALPVGDVGLAARDLWHHQRCS